MVKARHLWTNPSYLQNSVSLLLFFASWGIWWSFFQIWLTNDRTGLGLSGGEVGTIYSINSAATLVIMLFYGTIQDRLGIKRHLVTFCAAVGCFVGPFVMWVYRPLLETHFFLGAIVGAITGEGGIPGKALGAIDIFPSFSLVEIAGLEKKQAARISRARVAGRSLRIREDSGPKHADKRRFNDDRGAHKERRGKKSSDR